MDTNTPQTSLASRLGRDTITLFVGPTREEFTIHKQLICALPFFRAAFEGGFVERNGKMDLPEEKSEMMALFVGWIYQGKIESIYTQSHVNNLFYLCIFAEKICEVRLMDMTIDAIQDFSLACNAKLEPKTFFDVYQNAGDRSKMREFAIMFYAQQIVFSQCSPVEELWKYVKEDILFFCAIMSTVQEVCEIRNSHDFDVRRRVLPHDHQSVSKPIMFLGGCYWHVHRRRDNDPCPLGENLLENASKGEEEKNPRRRKIASRVL